MNPVRRHFLIKNLLGMFLLSFVLVEECVSGNAWVQGMETGMGLTSDFENVIAQPLTLQACVRIALGKNPLMRSAQDGVAAAQEGIGEARAPYYPDLGLNAGYGYWQRYAFLPKEITRLGISSIIGPTDDWGASLRARYTIFDSGERHAKWQAANAGKGLAEEESARVRSDIVLEIHISFYSLVSALETLSVAKQQLARAEDHLRLARERKAAGVVPLVDVVRAQVGVAEARLALVRVENLIRLSRGNLNTSMGLPVETPIQVEARAGEVRSADSIDLSQALDQAVRSRAELKASRQRINAARFAVDGAKSAYGPRIRAEGGYGWHDKDFLPQEEEWLVGVTVDLPLFTGFARKHRLAKARAEMSKEGAEMERISQKVRQEVWAAHSKLREAFEAIQAFEIQVKDARESHRLAQERYKVGAGTLTDLLDARTALDRAEANQVSSHWEYHIARSILSRATGTLTFDSPVQDTL